MRLSSVSAIRALIPLRWAPRAGRCRGFRWGRGRRTGGRGPQWRGWGRLLAAGAGAGLLLAAAPAVAYERQWRVGAGAGIATLDGTTVGPAIDAHAAYGLNDLFDVHLELLGSKHFRGEDSSVFSASAGVSYKIDVFQWVPYVGLFGGYYWYGGRPGANGESGHEGGVSIGGGLDYLVSRQLSLGAQVRQHTSFSDGLSFPYFNAVLRAEYRWGY